VAQGIPIFVFVLLALPALRLWRQRGAAERTVAAFFLLSGLGFSMRFRAVADGLLDSPAEIAVNVAGHLALSLACVALFAFTQRLFRPQERWARVLFWVASAGSIGAVALLFLDGGSQREDAASLLVLNSLRTASYGWSFAEAFLYWRQMRKRAALGLAEPLVANRFLLWSTWSGGLALCFGFVLATRIAGRMLGAGAELMPTVFPLIRIVLGAAIFTSAAAIWLCFFPPRRYTDWILRRAAAAA